MKYLITILFFLSNISLALAQTESDSVALYSQFEVQAEAYQQEKANEIAILYTKNAVLLPPGATPITGREKIQALFTKQFERLDADVEFNTIEVKIADGWAWRHGTYTVTISSATGEKIKITDKFLDIWQKGNDRTWRIARDMWNHNAPFSVRKKKMQKLQSN